VLAGFVGISLMGLVVMAYVQQDSEVPANSSSAEQTSPATDQVPEEPAPTDAFRDDITTVDEDIDALEADLDQLDQELNQVEGTR
jgi:small-conductance mechanosensitive channel